MHLIEETVCPLVSIIVPVYKSERYLNRCIQSIIKQTYSNIEIILVYNPDANDRCPSICEDFSRNYDGVILLEQEDIGPSHARNEAIKVSKGSFIAFVDSDDFVEFDYIETLMMGFDLYDYVMISMCCHSRFYGQKSWCDRSISGHCSKPLTDQQVFKKILQNQELCAPWGKLYRASIFGKNKFRISRNEDMFLIPILLKDARYIAYNESRLYYYSQEGESLVRSDYTAESMKTYYAANLFWVGICRDRYPALVPLAKSLLINNLIDICWQMLIDRRSEIRSVYIDCRSTLLQNVVSFECVRNIRWKAKIKFIFIFFLS